jgi:hypothetical protein
MRRFGAVSGRVLQAVAAASLVVLVALPRVALAADPTFGQPSATAVLGQPVTITSAITGRSIASVDVVVHLTGNSPQAGKNAAIILAAQQTSTGTWQAQQPIDIASSADCACLAAGNSSPNTHFDFQFRVHSADGSTSLGPVGQAVVDDNRFNWQTLSDRLVVVHWYSGDQAFAQNAANVANGAIDNASKLLGVTLDKPVDLYVYDTEEALRSAISPNRENIAGEAHPDIDTMYVNISPNDPGNFPDTVIKHELTHLVFHRAVDNPYNGVPRWLDEGVAVYLSEGYTDYWKGFVGGAVANKSLIPLKGLAGLFPSVQSEFYLAYGEAVASVDYFIRTYGDQTFWSLVKSYGTGVSDDDAFKAATGSDVEAFNKGWFESLGLEPQNPVGPQEGAPGPLPPSWTGGTGGAPSAAPSTTGPGATGPGATRPAAETTRPLATPEATAGSDVAAVRQTDISGILLLIGLVVALIVGTIVLALVLRGRFSGPPQPPAY